ncbi:MAG TPA: o-succinylbenzoate synthase [Isosphaeraceae bacterium]|jgi:O-succinylbenzoate synthase|nr:o-succinylbenzoate synthase [Isosphaeraceae bacterium]
MTDPIERVCLAHLQIPFKEPFRISGGEVAIKDAILVTVETANGLVGVGESSPMAASFGYSTDTPEQCWTELTEQIAPSLLGSRFDDLDQIAALASRWTCCKFAAAGAETACWDLIAQSWHMSLAEMLGATADRVRAWVESGLAVGLYPSIVELLQVIERHLSEGYKRVKIKIRPGQDVELVKAVRQHFGDLPLQVDANAAYTSDQIDVFRELDDYELLMFEQPMAADDLDGLAALQRAVSTPVCLDETADCLSRTAEAIRRDACRIVNIKLQRVGGFRAALALNDLCQQHGVACWVGTMPELGVGQAHGIHLATLTNCKYPTDIEPSSRWFVDDYVVPRIELSAAGLLSVPTRAGLGYQVDPVKVRRYQVQNCELKSRAMA